MCVEKLCNKVKPVPVSPCVWREAWSILCWRSRNDAYASSVCFMVNTLEPKTSNPILTCPEWKTDSNLRNAKQIFQWYTVDDALLSKFFLPDDISHIFDPPICADDNKAFTPPPWLLEAVATITNMQQSPPNASPLLFDVGHQARFQDSAAYNMSFLGCHNYNLA